MEVPWPYALPDSQIQALLAQIAQQQQQSGVPLIPQEKHHSRCRFSPEEDDLLRTLVAQLGTQDWTAISRHFLRRSPRQCRDRWKHYLSPDLLPEIWSDADNDLLFAKVAELGPRWAQIALLFPGRTDIRVKNHYMALKTKREREGQRVLDSGTRFLATE
jgi:hypothetical protein